MRIGHAAHAHGELRDRIAHAIHSCLRALCDCLPTLAFPVPMRSQGAYSTDCSDIFLHALLCALSTPAGQQTMLERLYAEAKPQDKSRSTHW